MLIFKKPDKKSKIKIDKLFYLGDSIKNKIIQGRWFIEYIRYLRIIKIISKKILTLIFIERAWISEINNKFVYIKCEKRKILTETEIEQT